MKNEKQWRDISFMGHSMSVKAVFVKGHAAPNVQDHDARGFDDDGVADDVEDLEFIKIHGDCGNSVMVSDELRDLIEATPGFVEACFKGR